MTTEYRSNQGSTMISEVLSDVPLADMETASESLWKEVGKHHHSATCDCPAIEVLCKLYELGYKVVKR